MQLLAIVPHFPAGVFSRRRLAARSPQFTKSLSLGIFTSHTTLRLQTTVLPNHPRKRCTEDIWAAGPAPTGRGLQGPGIPGPIPVGSGKGEPRRVVRPPCRSPAAVHRTGLRRKTRPQSAWHPGHRDPAPLNDRGEAPGMLQAHENSSWRRCALPQQLASSQRLLSAGGRVG